jgi:hypothetical protein
MSTARATEIINNQPALEPGDDGYWKVWGARVWDVQPGDLVVLKYSDGEVCEYEVREYAPREVRVRDGVANTVEDDLQARGHTPPGISYDQLRPRFRATDGELFSIGAMQPFVLLRKSTHNILADSVK